MKLASWNVNSLKVRLEQVLNWLESNNVDVLALQETKLTDDTFPREAFYELGYTAIYSGQKTYNGVAIISKLPIQQEYITDLSNYADPQRRILAATIDNLRLINLYVPNGASVDSDKYIYKLTWLSHIIDFIQHELKHYPHVAVVGDFNIAPSDNDVHDPILWQGSVLVSDKERQAFEQILSLGLIDSFRSQHPDAKDFSWWDYRAASFRRNHGLRIDHILLNEKLFAQCRDSYIDIIPRKTERPSDHTPILVEIDI